MAKKPLPFPERRSAVEPEPLSRSGSRLIFTIADRRFAFEFSSQVTELKPTPARILAFNSEKGKNVGREHGPANFLRSNGSGMASGQKQGGADLVEVARFGALLFVVDDHVVYILAFRVLAFAS